ncbi:MAG: hypothetical protein B7Z01_07605 [Brevundimonas subvibrioides]|uniref:Zinc finger CHCC-type domain-containing protein n=1 Tax=Brevundimonas subvibrioides TaxID=74313 RepID=A0A258FPG8_9CAUL|nr:MAG: hypothetical protein B7Z01_07605 [Brevundimonas subvibrioides]
MLISVDLPAPLGPRSPNIEPRGMTRSTPLSCDGGGVLGHPLVYLDMGGEDFVECGYCDRRFVLASDGHRENEYLDPAARGPGAH